MSDFSIKNGILEKYTGSASSVVVPYGVTDIDRSAFFWGDMERVLIPESVLRIDNGAFESCMKLERIDLPSRLEHIGSYAFSNCGALREVMIPDSVRVMGDNVFDGCDELETVWLSEGLEKLGDAVFMGCSALESIHLPSTLSEMGVFVFKECPNLTSITVEEGSPYFKSVDGNLYSADGSILYRYAPGKQASEFRIPYGVTEIFVGAFSQCEYLQSVIFPDSVRKIGYNAFEGSGLTSVKLPFGVSRVEQGTFVSCKELERVELHSGITYIGRAAFMECESLAEITLPMGLQVIRDSAFAVCSRLTDLTVPVSVAEIGNGAFQGCKRLCSVSIENIDVTIKAEPFYDCGSIEYIHCGYSVAAVLNSKLLASALRCFLLRYAEGDVSDGEARGWRALIESEEARCVGEMKDNVVFIKFMIDQGMLPPVKAKRLLERLVSLECRAVVLEYLRSFGEN